MRAKRILSWLFLVMVLGAVLSACGDDDSGGESAPTESTESTAADGGGGASDTIAVGMALPGPINDKGFNEAGYLGLQAIEAGGAEISYIENVQAADQVEALRNLAGQGLDLVIAHGGQFTDAAVQVAGEFPDVNFAVFNGTETAPNLSDYFIRYGTGSYLAGALAATISESGVVGFVGGAEIPPTLQSQEGFEAGAKHVDPDVEVLSTVVGDFNDAPRAKEAALAQIADGADVLYAFVDAGLPGVTEAAKGADHSVHMIGYIVPHCDADDIFVADAIFDSVTLYKQIGDAVKDGSWKGGEQVFTGLENPDVVSVQFCGDRVDADTQALIEDLGQQIVDGSLEIPEGL
ncbi:MAG: BMP family protein [Acidimicrobiia bacterium]|nr:BMP family protein [Acidimicrobiia bacterium]